MITWQPREISGECSNLTAEVLPILHLNEPRDFGFYGATQTLYHILVVERLGLRNRKSKLGWRRKSRSMFGAICAGRSGRFAQAPVNSELTAIVQTNLQQVQRLPVQAIRLD